MDGVTAFRDNSAAMFRLLPRYLTSARCWQEDGVLIMMAGWAASTFNGVFVLDEQLLTSEHIERLEQRFNDANIPLAFEVCSSSIGYNPVLIERDYPQIVSDPIMSCEGPLTVHRLNPKVLVRPLQTQQDKDAYKDIMIETFQMPADMMREIFDVMLKFEESRQMIAMLDGKLVGCGMLLYAEGVAAIYNVATLPAVQRQGVGTAMMAALHQKALDDGYKGTVLAVQSDQALSLYKNLGYREDGYQLVYARE